MSMRYQCPFRLLIAILALLVAFPGCHKVFPYPGATPPVDAAVPQLERNSAEDASPDVITFDLVATDVASPVDTSLDVPPPPNLTCTPPTTVGQDPPSAWAPALRVDGLQLVATTSNSSEFVATKRPAIKKLFGIWSAFDEVPNQYTDLSFFVDDSGTEVALATHQSTLQTRQLSLCSLISSQPCLDLTLNLLSGLATSADADGPSVIRLSGDLLMVFNLERVKDNQEVYLGKPSPSSLLTWNVGPIPTLSSSATGEDDPTISPDGLIIVFTYRKSNTNDLWFRQRPSINGSFGDPVVLANVNTTSNEGGALLSGIPNETTLELFFHSDRGDGDFKIYHSLCDR